MFRPLLYGMTVCFAASPAVAQSATMFLLGAPLQVGETQVGYISGVSSPRFQWLSETKAVLEFENEAVSLRAETELWNASEKEGARLLLGIPQKTKLEKTGEWSITALPGLWAAVLKVAKDHLVIKLPKELPIQEAQIVMPHDMPVRFPPCEVERYNHGFFESELFRNSQPWCHKDDESLEIWRRDFCKKTRLTPDSRRIFAKPLADAPSFKVAPLFSRTNVCASEETIGNQRLAVSFFTHGFVVDGYSALLKKRPKEKLRSEAVVVSMDGPSGDVVLVELPAGTKLFAPGSQKDMTDLEPMSSFGETKQPIQAYLSAARVETKKQTMSPQEFINSSFSRRNSPTFDALLYSKATKTLVNLKFMLDWNAIRSGQLKMRFEALPGSYGVESGKDQW